MTDLKIRISNDWATLNIGEGAAFTLWGMCQWRQPGGNRHTLRLAYAAYVAHLGGVSEVTFTEFMAHVQRVLADANFPEAGKLFAVEVA